MTTSQIITNVSGKLITEFHVLCFKRKEGEFSLERCAFEDMDGENYDASSSDDRKISASFSFMSVLYIAELISSRGK